MATKNYIVQQNDQRKAYSVFDINEYKDFSSDITFSVDIPEDANHTIAIGMKGSGNIKIFKNWVLAAELSLTESGETWTDSCRGGEKAVYQIDNADGITELDLHGNHITGLYFSRQLPLRKLMIYENDLQQLDCGNLTELQFLHMFSNPLCTVTDSITATVESLPNRREKAMGSIIFYPWHGLEILIEEVAETDGDGNVTGTKYVKYPYEPESPANFSCPSNPHYSWLYDSDGNYLFEPNRLYGIVQRGTTAAGPDSIIRYGEYKAVDSNGANPVYALVTNEEISNFHTVRRNALEPISLAKNWVFGSAIMYHSDWAKCPWDFRQNRVADMWETAEKGFGLAYGSTDRFALMFPGSKYLNILTYHDCEAVPAEGENYKRFCDFTDPAWGRSLDFFKAEINHGDEILSALCGNGAPSEAAPAGFQSTLTQTVNNTAVKTTYTFVPTEDDMRFGYVPLCKLHLRDRYTSLEQTDILQNNIQLFNNFAALTDCCDSVSSSIGYSSSRDFSEIDVLCADWRNAFQRFAKENVFTVGAGNGGDSKPYTDDTGPQSFGDALYGTNHSVTNDADRAGLILVYSVDRDKRASDFSDSGTVAERAKFTTVDAMIQYGEDIVVHRYFSENGNTLTGRMVYGHGCSLSAPILNGILMLLRIIYCKMFKDQSPSSFGKFSDFMNYVRSHWCDRLADQMDFASGYGMPDAFAEPVGENVFLSSQPLAEHINPGKLGEPIRFLYDAQATKSGFTLGYDRQMFAANDRGELYPIRTCADSQTITLYSNSARAKLEKDLYWRNYYEKTFSLSPIADNPALTLPESEDTEAGSDRTVLMLVDFVPEKLDPDMGSMDEKTVKTMFPCFAEVRDSSGKLRMSMEFTSGLSYSKNSGFDYANKKLVWHFYNENGKALGFNGLCHPLNAYLTNGRTSAVIAFVYNGSGLQVYFNGAPVGWSAEEDQLTPNLSMLNVSLSYTADQTLHIYSKAMTQTEVIRCTAALLRDYAAAAQPVQTRKISTVSQASGPLRYFKKTDANGRLLWIAQAVSAGDDSAVEITEEEYLTLRKAQSEDE